MNRHPWCKHTETVPVLIWTSSNTNDPPPEDQKPVLVCTECGEIVATCEEATR
jgi:hypothetical protein